MKTKHVLLINSFFEYPLLCCIEGDGITAEYKYSEFKFCPCCRQKLKKSGTVIVKSPKKMLDVLVPNRMSRGMLSELILPYCPRGY
jgi:hypothetical protein